MKEKQRIIDIIKAKIEKDFKDDVAIFAIYGSFATGTADEKSDIDFFFVPKTDRAYALSHQFIIDGIGYDLFPIGWDRIAEIAALNQPIMSVITEAQVVFASNTDDLKQFEEYRNNILKKFRHENKEMLLNKSYQSFNQTFIYLHNMKSEASQLLDMRLEASKIITKIGLAVAFANQTFYKKALGAYMESSFSFEKLPKNYQALIDAIIHTDDTQQIIESCEALIKNTREFLLKQRKSIANPEPIKKVFEGFFEELKSVLNKMLRACEQEDTYTAYLTAAYLHEEVAQFIAKAEEGIWYDDCNYYSEYKKAFEAFIGVDLMKLVAKKDFIALKEATLQFEQKFVELLRKNDVAITIYDSIDEFEVAYQGR